MATFLYRLGRWAFRRRRYVGLLWVAVLGVVAFGALNASDPPDDSSSMPGIEAQKAFDLINERFPGTEADGADARIVFVAPDGQKITSAANRSAIDALVAGTADGPQVADVVSPFDGRGVSKDATTAYATVTYDVKADDLTDASKQKLESAIEEARDSGLTVEAGGSALETEAASGTGEVIGVALAAVVLVITFGSLAAAGLPLLTALLGVGVSMASIIALGSVLGLSSTTGELAMMLGLAVGIDYSLFVVSRYREERAKGHGPQEATGLAVGTAGSAVVFAGLTVVIALAGLSVIGVPMLTQMGLGAAGAVLTGVLIALTVVPALLGCWPNAVLARQIRKGDGRVGKAGGRVRVGSGRVRVGRGRIRAGRTGGSVDGTESLGTRWARFVVRRPVPVLIASVVGLGALAVPAMDLRMGMPGDEAKSTATTERRAYDALADGFGPGFNGPLTVVVDAEGADDPEAAVSEISGRLAGTKGVVSVSPARFNKAQDTAVLSVTPSTAPAGGRPKD
ncbi:MMPL family transporter, partial [Streptomyces sp. ActVer]|uniref:MMPL family transporter n=1 Tax=Streptomyces sp. ActVer TaxID=3014558 RepID=UPI0022B3D53C